MSASAAIVERDLPWHAALWTQLRLAWREQRWPHGLLIHGPEGVGKRALAARLTAAVLCDRSGEDFSACGECAACRLLQAGTHPDFILLAPEEDKQQISVDQIREATARLALTSYRQGYKVAIVDPAHQMTLAAANSLLKTLEEPAARTCIVLLTSKSGALLPTLRSRCHQLKVASPSSAVAESWLASQGKEKANKLLSFVGGAPLRALALSEGDFETLWTGVTRDIGALLAGQEDVTQIAKRWSTESLPDRIACLDHWLCSLVREAVVGSADPITRTPLPRRPSELNISRLYGCLDRLRLLQAQLSKTALQRELAVDALLIDIAEAFNGRR